MQPQNLILPDGLRRALMQYLGGRPALEVCILLANLHSLEPVPVTPTDLEHFPSPKTKRRRGDTPAERGTQSD